MNGSSLVRFGVFEVNLRTREVRKRGIRLKIQDQPFAVLEALLERPGELVTREELQRRIWGSETFVDFEQSINRAVNKARETLSDDAGSPRYIETLPRRGYRFIAPVEVAGDLPPGLPVSESARERPVETTGGGSGMFSRSRLGWKFSGVAALVAVVWLFWPQRRDAPRPTLVQLTSFTGSERFPTFSPDGSQVAFAWDGGRNDNWDIYVKLVGETNALRLTADPAREEWPSWSPDGKRIAFQRSGRDGDAGIFLVSPLGGAEQKLADFPATGQMSWSPDGRWLAVSDSSGAALLLPVEGGESRRILSQTGTTLPAFSPDGSHLAYAACTGRYACDLYVQPLDRVFAARGEPRRITKQELYISGIAWSRDGESLVYSGSVTAGLLGSLWRVPVRRGSPPERLDLAGRSPLDPAIAPMGNRLAFARSLFDTDIWRYPIGGVPSAIITSTLTEANPQFSPDGKKIVFASTRSGGISEIWVVNADGSEPVQLTSRLGRHQGTPRWSPNGRWIAFDSQGQNGRWDIWVMEAGGGRPRQLTREHSDEYIPGWSHDSMWVYFSSDRSGGNQIWRAPLAGGQAEQITQDGGLIAFESSDGRALFYTKDAGVSSPLFRKPLAGAEERQVLDSVASRFFTVFEDGIYYVARAADGRNLLLFFDFATGARRELIEIEGTLGSGLAVSPDRKTFLLGRQMASGFDLMLIEDFR